MAHRWYSVSVLSNFEKKVAESIKESVEKQGLEDQIEDVLVPTEEVLEVRRGKKVTAERRFMPGYVLVRMEMTDAAYHLIKDTTRVPGFLGPEPRPLPFFPEPEPPRPFGFPAAARAVRGPRLPALLPGL